MATPQHTPNGDLVRAYLVSGWIHHLPDVASSLLSVLANSPRALSEAEVATAFESFRGGADGAAVWDAACYEEGRDTGVDRRRADGIAAHYGCGPLRTNRDVLALLVAAGVVERDGEGGLSPASPVPDLRGGLAGLAASGW
jgi:hypothetical protein